MRIFICFAHEERPIAKSLALALRNEGHTVFFDEDALRAGEEFNARIRDEIESSELFVVLASKHALEPGSYALTEIAVAEEVWPRANRRVLPVLLPGVEVEDLPPYLRSVHVLRSTGNFDADVAKAVATLAKAARNRMIIQVGTAIGFIVGLLALSGVVFPGESMDSRLRRSLAEDDAVSWLAAQEVPVWAIAPDAIGVVKASFYEGPIDADVFRKDMNIIRTYYTKFWTFLVSLETKHVGPILVNITPSFDIVVVVLLDCSTLDPSAALALAELPAVRAPGASAVYHTKVGDAEWAVALVATAGSSPLLGYKQWRYPRALIVGARGHVEALLQRRARGTWAVPASIRIAAGVAGTETWFTTTGQASARLLDTELFAEDELATPTAVLGWTRGLTPTLLDKVRRGGYKEWPEINATVALEYESREQAASAHDAVRAKLDAWARLDAAECDGFVARQLLVAQPTVMSFARAAIRAISTRADEHKAFLHFDSRRVVIDNDTLTREYVGLLEWSSTCAEHARRRKLGPPDPTLAVRFTIEIEGERASDVAEDALLTELQHVIDPTAIVLPLIERNLQNLDRVQRLWQFVAATVQNPHQLSRWVERGLAPLIGMTERFDPTHASTESAQLLAGTIVNALLVPGTLPIVMDDLAKTSIHPQIAAFAISAAVCNQRLLFSRDDLWLDFVRKVYETDYEHTALADGIVIAIAACVLTDPEQYFRERLAKVWAALPLWVKQRLRTEMTRQATADQQTKLADAIAKLPASDMKRHLSN